MYLEYDESHCEQVLNQGHNQMCKVRIRKVSNYQKMSTHSVIHVGLALEHLLGSLYVEKNVRKGANSILVTPHHHVGEAHIIVGGYLAGWDTGIEVLSIHIHITQHL